MLCYRRTPSPIDQFHANASSLQRYGIVGTFIKFTLLHTHYIYRIKETIHYDIHRRLQYRFYTLPNGWYYIPLHCWDKDNVGKYCSVYCKLQKVKI